MTINKAMRAADVKSMNSGLYVWTTPDARTSAGLVTALKGAPFVVDTDLHCTIMYATTLPVVPKAPSLKAFVAKVSRLALWGDHKGRQLCVLELDSPALQSAHRELKAQSIVHSYDSYEPHMTLAKGVSNNAELRLWMHEMNSRLNAWPVLSFKAACCSYLD